MANAAKPGDVQEPPSVGNTGLFWSGGDVQRSDSDSFDARDARRWTIGCSCDIWVAIRRQAAHGAL